MAWRISAGLASTIILASTFAHADSLIINGNFETGTLAGWTTSVQIGSAGNIFIAPSNGGNSPESGSSYALTIQAAGTFLPSPMRKARAHIR